MAASVSSVCVTLSKCLWSKNTLLYAVRRVSAAAACSRAAGSSLVESTAEFCFVERLIPPSRVPVPPKHAGPAPSGWTPPSESGLALPYTVRRSRMHNVPVYSDIKHGNQRSTVLRRVQGDIWALNRDLKEHLQRRTGSETHTKVSEVSMSIRVKGHFQSELKEWLLQLGF